MMEQFPQRSRQELPPCPRSHDCLRFFDELEDADMAAQENKETVLLAQLRTHVPTCPTCSTLLAAERRLRAWQRQSLQALLAEGAERVPTMATAIITVLRQEQIQHIVATPPSPEGASQEVSLRHDTQPRRFIAPRVGRVLGQLAALAAAVFLLASTIEAFQLLQARSEQQMAFQIARPTSAFTMPLTNAWSAVLLSYVQSGHLHIVNDEPLTGKNIELASSMYPHDTVIEGISHAGDAILYSVYNGKETSYWLRSTSMLFSLYQVAGRGSQAIWSTDDHYVFIGTGHGVEMLDIWSGTPQLILTQLTSPTLVFAYANYLYYLDGQRGMPGKLQRISISNGVIQTVTPCASSQPFWLSPTGTGIYYQCVGQTALYAVNVDGSQAHLVRANGGQVIGYTANNALLTLQHVGSVNQIVQLGSAQALDHVLLKQLAPGMLLTAAQVGVAPYGNALVATNVATDGTTMLWYANLATGQQRQFVFAQGVTTLQQNGWDRLYVPGS